MLIRLENGDWVDPRAVTGLDAIESMRGYRKPIVRVLLGDAIVMTSWSTDDEAKEARDRIAAKINEALEPRP